MKYFQFILAAFVSVSALAADNFVQEAKCLNAMSRLPSNVASVEQFGTATKYYHYKLIYDIDWSGGKKESPYSTNAEKLNEEESTPVIRMGRMKNGDSRYCSVDEQNGKLECWLVPENFVKKNMAKVVYVRIKPSGEVVPMEIGTKRNYLRSAPIRDLWRITNQEIKETEGAHDTYYAELLNGVFGAGLPVDVKPESVKASTAAKVAAEFNAQSIPPGEAKDIFRKHINFLFENIKDWHENAERKYSMEYYGTPTLMECLPFMEKNEESFKKFCNRMEKMFTEKCDASALLGRARSNPKVNESEKDNPPNDTWSAE